LTNAEAYNQRHNDATCHLADSDIL